MSKTRTLSLPEVAARLGLHRATINDFVLSERLPAVRVGAHWAVDADDFAEFAKSYVRPRSGRRRGSARAAQHWTEKILELLDDWGSASTSELEAVLDLHIGNIRKYLAIAEADGLVLRQDDGQWHHVRRTSGGQTSVA